VQHVEMVDDEGGTIGASASAGRVVQRRGLGDVGDRRLIGFISPSVYKGKRAGAQAGLAGDESEYLEEIKKRRQEFITFMETDAERSVRELFDDYQTALKGARNPEEQAKLGELYAQKRNDLEVESGTGEGQMIGFGRDMSAPDAAREMIAEMIETQRTAYEQRKAMGVEDTQARIAEINAVLQSDLVAQETRRGLEAEKYQLATDYQQLLTDNADQRVARTLEDLEFEQQTGQLSQSVAVERRPAELTARIGDGVKYGSILELKMDRPHMRLALTNKSADVRRILGG
jgi:hypothetical protein